MPTLRESLRPKGRVSLYAFDPKDVPTYDSLLDLCAVTLRVKSRGRWRWVPALDTLLIKPKVRLFQDNLIVNAGLMALANSLTVGPAFLLNYVGVGSSSTAPTATDTDLNTAIGSRVLVTSPYIISPNISVWDTFFGIGANNGNWNESGLFNASSGPTMGSHALFSSQFVKASTNTAVVEWKWTL